MAFFNNLFDSVRDRATAPALQNPALPQIQPTQMSGIGSMLPMQTITLPNGQSVQIPQINMDEINANLLASGITPQMPTPAVTPAPNDLGELLPLGTDNGIDMSDFLGNREDSLAAAQAMFGPQVQYATPTTGTGSGGLLGRTYTDEERAELGIPSYSGGFLGKGTGATTLPDREQPLAPYTGAGQTESPNYIPTMQRNETGMDALTQQLLFGLDGQGGFIPGAMQAAEKTFFNADGTPRVVEEQRAGFTGDQTSGMDLARSNVGIQDPFLTGAESSFRRGVTDIGQGIERGRGFQQRGLQELQSGIGNLQGELGGVEGIARGAAGNFGTQLGGIAGRGIGATDRFGRRLGESENLMRGTTGGYDQGLTSQFYNPYEDRVVQQTIDDVLEAGDKQDMAQRARDIQTAGS